MNICMVINGGRGKASRMEWAERKRTKPPQEKVNTEYLKLEIEESINNGDRNIQTAKMRRKVCFRAVKMKSAMGEEE